MCVGVLGIRGNDGHDDQRLKVGSEFDGQQHEHGNQGQHRPLHQTADRFRALLLLSFPTHADSRMFAQQVFQKFRAKIHLRDGTGGAIFNPPNDA